MSTSAGIAQKSILDVFPNELTMHIISLSNTSSQASLCRVCKLFKQLTIREMYQIVHLGNDDLAISFADVISDNPQYGVWVKELTILVLRDYDSADNPSNRILPRLSELRKLSLAYDTGGRPDFGSFSIDGYVDRREPNIFKAFLNRHPTLLYLDARVSSPAPLKTSPLVELPNLVVWRGLFVLRPRNLMNSNKLTSVWLHSDELDDLASFPACQDVVVQIRQSPSIQDIFKGLKHQLPNLKCCLRHSFWLLDLPTYILIEELSGFKQLESFGVVAPAGDPNDLPLIQSCLTSCPNLQECVFMNSFSYYSKGRYRIVDRKAVPMAWPCRIEAIFCTGRIGDMSSISGLMMCLRLQSFY
ncbi:hypothetical protein C8J56DRAFT_912403 [Mycena floridula]|nr:hypothetical protein C8J56DRAFT_912403 [Mycena floridula]